MKIFISLLVVSGALCLLCYVCFHNDLCLYFGVGILVVGFITDLIYENILNSFDLNIIRTSINLSRK